MRDGGVWGVLVVVATACGGAAAPGIASAPPEPASVASTTAASPALGSASASTGEGDVAASSTSTPTSTPTSNAVEVLLLTHGDVREKGDEPITLTSDGLVHVGDWTIHVDLARNEAFWKKQAGLAVVEIDKKKGVRGVLFTEPTDEGEDPPNHYRLVLAYDGALHLAYDKVLGAYGVTPLEFLGDGKARYHEDPWTACDRAKPKKTVKALDITLSLDKKKMLVEIAKKPSVATVKCDELAG
jgi:hypothetical protein